MVEYAATDAVKILVCTVAVGEVPVRCIVAIGFYGWIERAGCTAGDVDNFPSSNHSVICVVICAHIVIVRQLNLIVVEIKVHRVFVGDV